MNFVRLTLLRVAAVVALACCTGLVHAAELTGDAQGTGPQDAIRLLVEREMGPGHRVDVRVGQLDPRLQLQSCARIEPYLPLGTRLWGRTSIGVRCVQGAHWTVMLPVTVSVYGRALVAITPLAVGTSPSAADFRVDEVDLTRESGALVTDTAQLAGKELARPVHPGQPLRADVLRIPMTVAAGDPVRIVIVGQGFTILSEGVAMAPAGEGQSLRVRTESGKVVAGMVRDRSVELRI